METTEPRSWMPKLAIGAILFAGAVSTWWTVSRLWPEQPAPAMPPEQFVEAFKAADKVDRENWDRMWREAGKKPPPAR